MRQPWQPIETAPKDGTRVLLYFPPPSEHWKLCIEAGQWESDQYAARPKPYWTGDLERVYGITRYRKNQPTHWMPLPDVPAEKKFQKLTYL